LRAWLEDNNLVTGNKEDKLLRLESTGTLTIENIEHVVRLFLRVPDKC
jgi:hypothetical protein